MASFDAGVRRRAARRLLAWFDEHRRDVPWRRDRDPYRIWVSEVMLQQTQVSRVVDFFNRFMDRFPDLSSLAAAPEADVLRLWEGLGYYRRARDLHRAAIRVVTEFGGVIPDDAERFGTLPGVGRYTCNAILSQAFERRLPVLEANSRRVLSRVLGEAGDPKSAAVQNRLWGAAEELLPPSRVGDFNQAVMELGALVCTPAAPGCSGCPLAADCRARAENTQDQIPPPPPPKVPLVSREAAFLIVNGVGQERHVLLVQRPPDGRWANLWEFPHGPVRNDPARQELEALARSLTGFEVRILGDLMTVRHSVTRHDITMTAHEASRVGGSFQSAFYVRGEWVSPAGLADFPVSNPQRRLARAWADPVRQRGLFDG